MQGRDRARPSARRSGSRNKHSIARDERDEDQDAEEGQRIHRILPGTGRWQARAAGLTEGAPLHHFASLRGPPPRSGEDFPGGSHLAHQIAQLAAPIRPSSITSA